MNNRKLYRPIAAILALVMVFSLLGGVPLFASAEGTTYVLDATADLTAFAQGAKADGESESAGTDGYFTIFYSAKTKVDGSSKTFDDGYTASQRINFGGKSDFDSLKNLVRFNTAAPAEVKLWWVSGGDGRTMAIWDSAGAVFAATNAAGSVKNALYISAFTLEDPGTYYIALPEGSNYLFKASVTETSGGAVEKPERAPWDTVEAPVITGTAQDGGDVVVTVDALVGYDGADQVVVVMRSGFGAELASKRSLAEKDSHSLTFTPDASGEYFFQATASRENEEDKLSETAAIAYVLPLQTPALSWAVNAGSGSIRLAWGAVAEADGYEVCVNGAAAGTTEALEYTLTGLTVGESCSVQVAAVRGTETSALSDALTLVVTGEAQRIWGFTRYGSSTNDGNNGYTGSVNEDGSVTVYSEGGRGKIVPNSTDGVSDAAATREDPIDIHTAVENVHAGQTIVLLEGSYLLSRSLHIYRGIDGTAEAPIVMMADAGTRPVLDFQSQCVGVVHGGDWWHFLGIDVTRSQNGQKGFQVSGDHNVLEQIHTYHNGNTGIQISRYNGTDTTIDQWPSHNLILNCTSYGNADAGYEDADGFAAKLTCGVGNVFDGCVAYNNADDGWDLYAKVETGPIGSVTIRNCVAYANGYLEDGTNAGNGNGFKMGGESITGKHVLIGSYAFFNKAKGIDSNSCPDIIVRDSIAYNNESYNVAFYTNNANHTDFAADGVISFKDERIRSGLAVGDNLKPKGTQDTAKYIPMSKSTIATVALFFAISRWNGYFWARQMISNSNEHPLQVFIRLKLEEFTDPEAMAGWNEIYSSDSVIYALIVCSIVPILIIYPFIQKYFAKGANVGGVKE